MNIRTVKSVYIIIVIGLLALALIISLSSFYNIIDFIGLESILPLLSIVIAIISLKTADKKILSMIIKTELVKEKKNMNLDWKSGIDRNLALLPPIFLLKYKQNCLSQGEYHPVFTGDILESSKRYW